MKTTLLKIVFTSVFVSVVFIGKSFASNAASVDANASFSNASTHDSTNDHRRKIRLGFTAPSTMNRQLLLTEDENATSGIDWGYDGEYYETIHDDMYWLIEGELFTIQGTNVIDEQSNFPIGFHTIDSGMNTIRIDALENISDDFDLFLYDSELEVTHNLRDGGYEFYAEAGEYLDRFQLIFKEPQTNAESLSIDENEFETFRLYYNTNSSTLVVNNPSNATLKTLSVYNMAGQLVHNKTLNQSSTRQEVQFYNQPVRGTYIVILETESGTTSKKMVF